MPPHPVDPTVNTPEEGTYYYRSFWGSYKGHAMGLVRGVLAGGIFGALTGGIVLGGAALLGVGFVATMGVPALMAIFTGLGALLGADVMGSAGHSAGAAAAATTEEELRLRYPGSGDGIANSRTSPQIGAGHHYETLEQPPKLFHTDVGLPMGALFAGVGALLAFGALAVMPPVAGIAMLGAEGLTGTLLGAAGSTGLIAAVAAMGGVLGASFGVDRAYFKSLFNHSDEWVNGKLLRTGSTVTPEVEASQELTREAAEGKARPMITTLERQEEFHRLFNDYFEKTFWSSITGNVKGLIGGLTIGAAIGAGLGGLVALAFPAIGLPILLAATALGAHEGMNIFTRAGADGGAQAAAKEALEVKRQRLQKGLDPELQPAAPGADRWFTPRTALVGLAIGLLGGAILGPLVGIHMVELLGAHIVGTGLLASIAGALPGFGVLGAHAATHLVAGTAISGLIGGAVGASSGLGLPAYKSMAGLSDSFYGGGVLRGEFKTEHEHRKIPYLAPNSPWVPRDEIARETSAGFTIPNPHGRSTPLVSEARGAATLPTSPAPAKEAAQSAETAMTSTFAPDPAPSPLRSNYPVTQPLTERLRHIIETRKPEAERGALARLDERRAQAADPTMGGIV